MATSGDSTNPDKQFTTAVKTVSSLTIGEMAAMAALFSEHYGMWGPGGRSPGQRIRLSVDRLQAGYLFDEHCGAVIAAAIDGTIIEQLLFRRFHFGLGDALWISQLAVRSEWRSRTVATALVRSGIAECRNLQACGMAASHPYAVRAMENAVGVRCSPSVISTVAVPFLVACGIPYVQGMPLRISQLPPTSVVNTSYFVNHAEVNAIRASMPDWLLGEIADGEEFFAVAVRST